MEIIAWEQKHTRLKVTLPSKEVLEYRLSARVFRKFQKCVMFYINEILKSSPDSFKEYYLDILKTYYQTKDCRYIINSEFINQIKKHVNTYIEKNKDKILITLKKDGTLNENQVLSIFRVSFYLKMFALFMYTIPPLLEEEQKFLFRQLSTELRENGVDEYLFDFIRLKFLAKANNSFWQWISSVKFQDISYYITNTYFVVISQILLQLVIGYNPIAFIKTIVENTIHFLVTDVYLDEVKYIEQESKKLRYTKSYSLIEKHVLKNIYEYIVAAVKNFYEEGHQPIPKLNNRNIKPIFHYITLPLMTKITNFSYIYFYSIKDSHYLNLYTGMILDYLSPQLILLRKITRSYCLPKNKSRIPSTIYEIIKPLYEINHPLQKIYQETKAFDNVLKILLTHDYWDIFSNQKLDSFSMQKLAEEIKAYYSHFILSNKFNSILMSLKRDGFEIPRSTTSFLKIAV